MYAAKFEWIHGFTDDVCKAMCVVLHSNFASYIVCRRYKPCEFLGFVWTDYWGNKSYYVITSSANWKRGTVMQFEGYWSSLAFQQYSGSRIVALGILRTGYACFDFII